MFNKYFRHFIPSPQPSRKAKAKAKAPRSYYNYIRIVHVGEDYITVKKGARRYNVTDPAAISIIKALIKKLKKQ